MNVRVFVADDHGVLRGGLRALIDMQADMEVVGEADNGLDAEIGITKTEPDVALIDSARHAAEALAAMAAVKHVCSSKRIIALTVHEEIGYIRAAEAVGLTGYVVKTAVDTELLAAIRAVSETVRRLAWLPSSTTRLTAGRRLQRLAIAGSCSVRLQSLTCPPGLPLRRRVRWLVWRAHTPTVRPHWPRSIESYADTRSAFPEASAVMVVEISGASAARAVTSSSNPAVNRSRAPSPLRCPSSA